MHRGEDPTACTQQLDKIYDDNALDNALTSSEESCARERERETVGISKRQQRNKRNRCR